MSVNAIGYAYEADVHCPACTVARYKNGGFNPGPHGPGEDEHGIPYGAEDNEGNILHAIFSTDEGAEVCGDCGEKL